MSLSLYDPTAHGQQFTQGIVDGAVHYHRDYSGKMLTDQDLCNFCCTRLVLLQPYRYSLGYITGWLLGFTESASPLLPSPLVPYLYLGKGFLELTQQKQFVNGYQVGHLTCMVQCRNQERTAQEIPALVDVLLAKARENDLYNTGMLVGWLVTAIQKGQCTGTQRAHLETAQAQASSLRGEAPHASNRC